MKRPVFSCPSKDQATRVWFIFRIVFDYFPLQDRLEYFANESMSGKVWQSSLLNNRPDPISNSFGDTGMDREGDQTFR